MKVLRAFHQLGKRREPFAGRFGLGVRDLQENGAVTLDDEGSRRYPSSGGVGGKPLSKHCIARCYICLVVRSAHAKAPLVAKAMRHWFQVCWSNGVIRWVLVACRRVQATGSAGLI